MEKRIATTGYLEQVVTAGEGSCAATVGDWANAETVGDWAHAVTTGYRADASTAGNKANAVATGDKASASTDGQYAVAAALGVDGRAKAGPDGAIVLCFFEAGGRLLHIRASKVGENGIKPHVWYRLNEFGEFVEVTAKEI
jgi:hypothetical protein